jgi:hypothetical protein
MENVRQHRHSGNRVNLAFERIEHPTGGSNCEDEPLVTGDAGVPLCRRGLRLIWIQALLVNSKILRWPQKFALSESQIIEP